MAGGMVLVSYRNGIELIDEAIRTADALQDSKPSFLARRKDSCVFVILPLTVYWIAPISYAIEEALFLLIS